MTVIRSRIVRRGLMDDAIRSGRRLLVLVVYCLPVAGVQSVRTVEVVRTMRPIQCDGFLMEWRESDAQRLADVGGAVWDVANTADGLVGYVRTAMSDSCRLAGVMLTTGGQQSGERLGLVGLDGTGRGRVQCAAGSIADETERVLEFMLPWDSLALDSSGCYAVRLSMLTSCDSASGIVELVGCRKTLAARVITPRIKVQLGLIAVLLVAYGVMSRRIRKTQTNRTQSPHQ